MLILSDSKHKNCRRNGIVHFFYHQQLCLLFVQEETCTKGNIVIRGKNHVIFICYGINLNTIP
jgi:hypothetical protein